MAKEILIADSDGADQKEFQKIFETTDYHLIFSESGEEALLRTKLFKPDLIIASGAGLQEMGGLELCEAIKGDPDFKHIPFILISSIFDEISEKDRKHFQADGVISRPLNEGEVLHLVDDLMEEEAVGKRGEMVSEKEEFLSDEIGEEEEEIIELVDVVEEPEPRMSIDSFVPTEKEDSFGGLAPMDSWEKLEFEEKPEEKELVPRYEKRIGGMELRLKRKMSFKEASPEDELFDKIELEEILEKVEQLKPSLDKEWPSARELTRTEERPVKMAEPAEKHLDLSEFETALQKEMRPAPPEVELEPFLIKEPKEEISHEEMEITAPETEPQPFYVEEPKEETSQKEMRVTAPEEELQPFDVEEPKEEISGEIPSIEELVEEEDLIELAEEEFPEELLEDILGEEEVGAIAGPKELETEEMRPEEIRAEEIEEIKEIEATKGIEEITGIEEIEEILEIAETEEIEELEAFEDAEIKEEIGEIEEIEKIEKIEEIRSDRLEEVEAPEPIREEVPPFMRAVDSQMQEVISKRVQEIMEEIITKLVPEMTQNVVGLTLERIEKMVKEVVPDLAEKAIQEEIKRLQKGEKE